MRFKGILSVAAVVMGLLGCSDDGAGTIVSTEASWITGCANTGCQLYTLHYQDEETTFKASCEKVATGYDITITDPSVKAVVGDLSMPGRPGGSLTIRNADPRVNRCDVEVRERAAANFPVTVLTGACGTVCTLTSTSDGADWDFSAQLSCSGLSPQYQPGGPSYTLGSGDGSGQPILLRLDNCD